jgi:hypothetical protein
MTLTGGDDLLGSRVVAQAHARPSAVGVDEFDPGLLKRRAELGSVARRIPYLVMLKGVMHNLTQKV